MYDDKVIELVRLSGYDCYKLLVYRRCGGKLRVTIPDKIEDKGDGFEEIIWKEIEIDSLAEVPPVLVVTGPQLQDIGPNLAEALAERGVKTKAHKQTEHLLKVYGQHLEDLRKALNLFLDAKKEAFWEGITTGSAQT